MRPSSTDNMMASPSPYLKNLIRSPSSYTSLHRSLTGRTRKLQKMTSQDSWQRDKSPLQQNIFDATSSYEQRRSSIEQSCYRLFRIRKHSEPIKFTPKLVEDVSQVEQNSQVLQKLKTVKSLPLSPDKKPFFLQDKKPKNIAVQTILSGFSADDLKQQPDSQNSSVQFEQQKIAQKEANKLQVCEQHHRRSRFFQEMRMCTQSTQTDLSIVQEKEQIPLRLSVDVAIESPVWKQQNIPSYTLVAEIYFKEQNSKDLENYNLFYKKVQIKYDAQLQSEPPLQPNQIRHSFQISLDGTDFDQLKRLIYQQRINNVFCCVCLSLKFSNEILARSLARLRVPLFERELQVQQGTTVFYLPPAAPPLLALPAPDQWLQSRLAIGKALNCRVHQRHDNISSSLNVTLLQENSAENLSILSSCRSLEELSASLPIQERLFSSVCTIPHPKMHFNFSVKQSESDRQIIQQQNIMRYSNLTSSIGFKNPLPKNYQQVQNFMQLTKSFIKQRQNHLADKQSQN